MMQKKYYISDIMFEVQSDIPLDEYDAENKFQDTSLQTEHVYQVNVILTDEIPIPDSEPIAMDNCYVWFLNDNINAREVRIYPYGGICRYAISSTLSENRILIQIKRSVWEIRMTSFRIWSYLFLEQILLKHDALILHSASIIYNGRAILFTAPSEIGKTTQTDIWHRNNASVTDLNGDRTILKKTANGWIACGIPISGTSTRCEQAAVPIAAIVFVNRAVVDTTSFPGLIKKIQFLYGQVTVFSMDEGDAEKALNLLEDIVSCVKIVQLNCTMQDSAYRVLREEIDKG